MVDKQFKGISFLGTALIIISPLAAIFYSLNPARLSTASDYVIDFCWIGMGILGLVAGIGIRFRKNIFRRIAVLVGFWVSFEGFWRIARFVKLNAALGQKVAEKSLEINLPEPVILLIVLTPIVIFHIIQFSYSIALIWYFTRPRIKEQFK